VNVVSTGSAGILIVEPRLRTDKRGFFFEAYHFARYAEHGIKPPLCCRIICPAPGKAYCADFISNVGWHKASWSASRVAG